MERNDGKAFEEEFAIYMRSKGWRTKHEGVKGKASTRLHDCDIHGQRLSWVRIGIGVIFVGLAAASAVAGIAPPEFEKMTGLVVADIADVFLPVFLVCLLVGLLTLLKSNIHVWVECKDRRESIKRADISKLVEAVRDAKKHAAHVEAKKARAHRPLPAEELRNTWGANQTWFASSGRYDKDAINHARENKIRCFQRVGPGNFEEL